MGPFGLELTSSTAARIPSKDELIERTESSLSYRCDPQNQPPATPEPDPQTHISTEVAGSKLEEGSKKQNAGSQQPQGSGQLNHEKSSLRRRALQIRPLSWLALSRPPLESHCPRSMSAQLPTAASTSTVARSVISAPVLTSTTNVQVACTEGVHCGEISDLTFSQPTWNSRVGSVAKPTDSQRGGTGPDDAAPNLGMSLNPGPTLANASAVSRRRIFQFGDIVRRKIGSRPLKKPTGGSSPLQSAEARAEDSDTGLAPAALESSLARRRAETLNLYKGKIKGLTGNGHVRRKSLNSSKDLAETAKDPPLLGEFTDTQLTDTKAEQSDDDSAFGSLTRSFVSAVDKLDFHSPLPRNIPFLRSRSSFFHPKKGDNAAGESSETKRQFARISPPPPVLSSSTPSTLSLAPPDPPPAAKLDKAAHNELVAQQSAPSPMVFSKEKNKYVPAKPVAGSPRGINPFRMHPPDAMASPPSLSYQPVPAGPTASNVPSDSPQRQETTASEHGEENDDLASLENAPIYSPSLGDLSQYARDTPQSTRDGRPESARAKAVEATPTRNAITDKKTLYGHRGLLRKSKSGVGLFSRTKPDQSMTMSSSRSGVSEGSAPTSSSMLRPLYERDSNQKLAARSEKSLRKSRSLHFGGLFKKENHSSLSIPMAREVSFPFQPATPSPLRNVTRARRHDVDQARIQESPSPFPMARKQGTPKEWDKHFDGKRRRP